jgi:hypothetical protein
MINGPDVGMAIPADFVNAFLKQLDKLQPARAPRHAESVRV